ncbi:MAG: M48 family metallopeptidase [Candidatus Krumholzibacteriota bacterium]|nr:M48 family metallopeptidase [Candidatus Krumholzibacteriota bacterium]
MYAEIARNRRNSWLLVVVVSAVLLLLGWALGEYWGNSWFGVGLAVAVAVVTSLVSFFGGGSIILTMSRAKKIEKKDAPQLFNVVEELSIAAGLPMPAVYLIDDTAPNAFATGRDPEHAAVAITSGLLEKLTRDELQGVMAHELSHVRNRDILFSMMVGIMVGSIVLLSDFFMRSFLWGGGRRRKSGGKDGGNAIFAVVAILLAIVAPIFAKLLQLAVSRQREYLADASAVQLTRYPAGLAGALRKISGDREVLEAANRATQHLYIVNPIKPFEKRAKSLFSTHPPIEERIERIMSM